MLFHLLEYGRFKERFRYYIVAACCIDLLVILLEGARSESNYWRAANAVLNLSYPLCSLISIHYLHPHIHPYKIGLPLSPYLERLFAVCRLSGAEADGF